MRYYVARRNADFCQKPCVLDPLLQTQEQPCRAWANKSGCPMRVAAFQQPSQTKLAAIAHLGAQTYHFA
eukprot:1543050-Lingulodinium_polyedra.AAC.1